jgi:hypothetical protein
MWRLESEDWYNERGASVARGPERRLLRLLSATPAAAVHPLAVFAGCGASPPSPPPPYLPCLTPPGRHVG